MLRLGGQFILATWLCRLAITCFILSMQTRNLTGGLSPGTSPSS